MAVVYSKVLLFDPPLIYTAPDICVFGAVIVLRFHSIFLYMKETTSKRTNSLHSFLLKYILYTTNIFSIFQANTSGVARKEDWGWPALGGPGSVQSQDIQRVEMSALPTEPSLQPAQLY